MYKIDWTVAETGRAHAHRRVLCVCTAESNFNLIEAHNSAPHQDLVSVRGREHEIDRKK